MTVPEQVAVVGFDDIEDGRYGRPSLTTIAPDKGAIAEAAMDALVRRIGGDDSAPQRVLAPHRLVERESTSVTATSQPPDVSDAQVTPVT